MMRVSRCFGRLSLVCILVLSAASFARGAASSSAAPSPYEVAWDSPSADCNGTMPLGNGEVALNAWIEPGGDLRFYIARTDSWDDNSRLVKVGSVRVRLGEGNAPKANFRQVLTVKDGTMSAAWNDGAGSVKLRLWVDANRPLVYVEAETASATEAAAMIELWRKQREALASVECADIYFGRPEKTYVEPDTVAAGLKDRVGWYHRNSRSLGPELCAQIQGVADFPRPEPLLGRTFGAIIAADRPQRVDDLTLKSTNGTRHLFEICVNTIHPATGEQWLEQTGKTLDEARAIPFERRRAAHEKWWADFWDRSYIHLTTNGRPAGAGVEAVNQAIPANKHPVRIGMSQAGAERFAGELGRVSLYEGPLTEAEVAALAAAGPDKPAPDRADKIFTEQPAAPKAVAELASRTFAQGLTVEAWIKLDAKNHKRGMRILDKITAGGADGFLLDTNPGASLRAIVGRATVTAKEVLRAGSWQHVAMSVGPDGRARLFLDGKPLAGGSAEAALAGGDDAFMVTRAYVLQRYINACAGRGRYPIKFNGSLFTVPHKGGPGDADYRRWGGGYWWQNTRLPYYDMCLAGDYEMMQPLFQMYGRDLMGLQKFRTRKYMEHEGAYIPECIYFWGDVFTQSYGWQPAAERTDKLQVAGWHKWEWVSGLELTGLMLDYYDHTQDEKFLQDTALPTAHEILAYFDLHYTNGEDGKMRMHPAQALETWWDCVNPMPELAGLHAITSRLLALPESQTTADQRAFWTKLRSRLPEIPTTQDAKGNTMLAPAGIFKNKRNIENPELYGVFPFRLFAIDKPNIEWAKAALAARRDRGAQGWRQDDIFMAYLGLANDARANVVHRARHKHAASRFPAFWGPNYDWVPDQDHGTVMVRALQSMLLQTDGRTIYLMPAWPADWDARFKLHAPYNTVISGRVENGKFLDLDVQPAGRRADVKVWTEQ